MSTQTPVKSKFIKGDCVTVLANDGTILNDSAQVVQVLEPGPDGQQYYRLNTGSPSGWPESGLRLDNLALALQLAGRGWYVFPCREKPGKPYTTKRRATVTPQAKQPYWDKSDLQHGKDNATTDPDLIRRWWSRWPAALVGVYCEQSGFFALDIDTKHEVDGWLTWQGLFQKYNNGLHPKFGPAQQTPSGGAHFLFTLPADLKIPNNASKLGDGLDLRSDGYICTGGDYRWYVDHGPESELTPAPAWLLDLIRNLGSKPAAPHQTTQTAPALNINTDSGEYWLNKALARAFEGNRNDTGFWLACQLRDSGMTQGAAESVLITYSQRVPGTGYAEAEALASLKKAYETGPRAPAKSINSFGGNGHHSQQEHGGAAPQAVGNPVQPEKNHLTDLGNAQRFAAQHKGRALFVEAWGWLIWTGKKWEIDESGLAMRLAKQTIKSLYREAEAIPDKEKAAIKEAEQAAEENNMAKAEAAQKKAKDLGELAQQLLKHALKSQARPRIESVLALGKSEPDISARPDDFDTDAWLLNCQNGILDLRSGQLRPHDPQARLTKIAGAVYDPGAACPRWLEFLNRIFAGDQSMVDFVQRAAGYTLTGNIGEHCLFFLYGSGANGKSTFTETLQAVLGEYARKTPTDTLMVKYRDTTIPNDVARLAGARMVSAAELAEGKRLNESLVKDLTGGDLITARFLRLEFFDFRPVFKLWMYGNHKPDIRGTDEGIWRRLKLIPFEVTIPEGERDKHLPDKLREELPGILAWMVQGCLLWQRGGLAFPEKVKQATASYRASQDTLGEFIADCCVINPLATVKAGDLYNAYKTWCSDSGAEPINQTLFGRQITERGYKKDRKQGVILYFGLGLLAEN